MKIHRVSTDIQCSKKKENLHLDEVFLKEDLNHLLENWKQARMVDANTSLQ